MNDIINGLLSDRDASMSGGNLAQLSMKAAKDGDAGASPLLGGKIEKANPLMNQRREGFKKTQGLQSGGGGLGSMSTRKRRRFGD